MEIRIFVSYFKSGFILSYKKKKIEIKILILFKKDYD